MSDAYAWAGLSCEGKGGGASMREYALCRLIVCVCVCCVLVMMGHPCASRTACDGFRAIKAQCSLRGCVERRYSRWVCVRNVIASGCPRIHGIPGVVHITVVLPYMVVRSREQGAESSLNSVVESFLSSLVLPSLRVLPLISPGLGVL